MKNESRVSPPWINVTPLIDVLLVLLIIFMVMSPGRPHRFETKIPERQESDVEYENDLALVVTIDREKGYLVNSTPASSIAELEALLRSALDGRPSDRRSIFIKAPQTCRYGDVIQVIDAMKAAGGAPIGLQIENLDR